MTGVAREIILNGKLVLDAMIAVEEHNIPTTPKMLGIEEPPK
jgi:hypothetical protein